MFSHYESLDLEDIGVWQDKENKSKKQRKCQSSFRPEAWPSLLHINIMKLSLSVRSPEEGEETSLPQNWKGDGERMAVAQSTPEELASPGGSRK